MDFHTASLVGIGRDGENISFAFIDLSSPMSDSFPQTHTKKGGRAVTSQISLKCP